MENFTAKGAENRELCALCGSFFHFSVPWTMSKADFAICWNFFIVFQAHIR